MDLQLCSLLLLLAGTSWLQCASEETSTKAEITFADTRKVFLDDDLKTLEDKSHKFSTVQSEATLSTPRVKITADFKQTQDVVSNVDTMFADNEEVFLVGNLKTLQDKSQKFVLVEAESRQGNSRFEIYVDFKQPQVIIRMVDAGYREYQLNFSTRDLNMNDNTKLMFVFSKLSQNHNSVSLYVNCVNIGDYQTEVPLRRIFVTNMTTRLSAAFQWHVGKSLQEMLSFIGCFSRTHKPRLEVPERSRSQDLITARQTKDRTPVSLRDPPSTTQKVPKPRTESKREKTIRSVQF